MAKTYADSYIYQKFPDYGREMYKFIVSANRIDTKSTEFENILFDVKRRKISDKLAKVITSDNVVIGISDDKSLPKAYRVFVAQDVKVDKKYEENAKRFQYTPPTEKEREEKREQIRIAAKKISEIIKETPIIECRRLSYNKTQIDNDGMGIRKNYSYQMDYGEEWISGSMLCFFESDDFMKKVESSINQIEKTNTERIKRDGDQAELIKYNFYNIKGKDTGNRLLLFQYKLLENVTCTIGLGSW